MSTELTEIKADDQLVIIAERLKRRELEIDALVEQAAFAGVKAIRIAFEQGDDLLLAKANIAHGLYLDWLSENFPKGHHTACRYMRLAAIPKDKRTEFLKETKSLRGALQIIGVIPPDEKQIGDGMHIVIPPEVQKLNWIAEWVERDADKIMTYESGQREELKVKLLPIVKLYERL